MLKLILFITLLYWSTFSFAFQNWNGRIFQVNMQKEIFFDELLTHLNEEKIIIFGEQHNTTAIQLAESLIIKNVVISQHNQGKFLAAWEFLNYTEQKNISYAFNQFIADKITAEEFLIQTQGTAQNISYIPIFKTLKLFQGDLIGVNISREAKAPVLEGGIDAIDPKYIPPNFALGSVNYFQRFKDVMKDHVPSDRIENYFAAQCLTDDIMAHTLQQNINPPLIFLITGNFHTDYYDGIVNRIRVRQSVNPIIIRFIDASDFDSKELNELLPQLLHDEKYGDIADYVYFVNEPNSLHNN